MPGTSLLIAILYRVNSHRTRSNQSLPHPRRSPFISQASLLCIRASRLALPAAVDRVVVRDPVAGSGPLVAEVTAEASGDSLAFSARVRDGEGKVHVEVEGYRTSRMPNSLPEDEAGPFRKVVV